MGEHEAEDRRTVTDGTPIETVQVHACTIATDAPESDGTLDWDSTTIVIVEARAGGVSGLGYTYADTATAALARETLAGIVTGRDAMAVQASWYAMVHATRNLGRPGVVSMAISAVDCALWDLKARLLKLPLATLLGAVRDSIPVYGSGGFTSYTDEQLVEQFEHWRGEGIRWMKMKVGRDPENDLRRVAAARDAIGPAAGLFVDANGGYDRKQALYFAERFQKDCGVTWFEEPVSSDDLLGLRLLRDRCPPPMEIAAGEYGYDVDYFVQMLRAGAVDCMQVDVTRCSGITGFLKVAELCEAEHIPMSAHCAPALHAHLGCAVAPLRHVEYFHDHVRIEGMLFEGVSELRQGALHPDRTRHGTGMALKTAEAARYAA